MDIRATALFEDLPLKSTNSWFKQKYPELEDKYDALCQKALSSLWRYAKKSGWGECGPGVCVIISSSWIHLSSSRTLTKNIVWSACRPQDQWPTTESSETNIKFRLLFCNYIHIKSLDVSKKKLMVKVTNYPAHQRVFQTRSTLKAVDVRKQYRWPNLSRRSESHTWWPRPLQMTTQYHTLKLFIKIYNYCFPKISQEWP